MIRDMTLRFVVAWIAVGAAGAELPVIRGVQVDERAYFSSADGEPAEFRADGEVAFLAGCSWYCGGDVDRITASSSLADSGDISYGATNAHDFDATTAWVEGKDGDGIGEWISYDFIFDAEGYLGTLGVNTLIVANGYKKSRELWAANGRIKRMKVFKDGEAIAWVDLLDVYELQTVEIPLIMFPAGQHVSLRFEIAEVYAGSRHHDTALSLLMFDGVGVH